MNLEVERITKEEVSENTKRMNIGKTVGPDDIPVEVWKCLGESVLEFLGKLYNRTMESERVPLEWRDSVQIPISKNKGDVHSCSNYRGIQLICHTTKLCERGEVMFSEQQWYHAREKHYRCIVCFGTADGEVHRRPERATSCVCVWTWRKLTTRC